MSRLPTELHNIAPPTLGPDGLWQGDLALLNPDPASTFEATEELLTYFSRLAATGAFALSLEHVPNSSIAVNVQRSPGRLAAEVTAKNVHPGAWRVLLQMLAHCHAMEPFEALTWADRRAVTALPAEPVPTPSVLHAYPPLLNHPVLVEALSSWGGEETLTIEVKCGRNLLNAELDLIATAVEDWGSLVYVGGFTPLSIEIDAPLIDPPRVVRQGWSGFDVSVPHWVPNVHAAAMLLNLLIVMEKDLAITAIDLQ